VDEAPGSDGDFAPAAFFAVARQRLLAEPPDETVTAIGDHVLNPDFLVADAKYQEAAVLIPVMARTPAATVLLTRRMPHLSAHAGQVAFPGGKIDRADGGPAAAALREAGEEIGLDPAAVSIVGYLDPYISRTGYRIVPVLGRVEPDPPLRLNRAEVEAAFEVPLAFLMAPANHRRTSRVFRGRTRYFYEMPYGEHHIWGVTAGIIRGLYERIFG
jgi:8-oxo-dGTP pyrophosphatase MutT (NUDIX family)